MKFSLNKNSITPEIARILAEAKKPRVLYQAGAKAVQKEIVTHLRNLESRGNIKGWPSQHFFARGATSVEKNVGVARLDDRGAVITIADPRFVHRITGGTVTPKRAQFIAIPLTAEAYAVSGKGSLRESMPGLKVVKLPRGLFLVKELSEKTSGRGGVDRIRIVLLFKLVKSVTHNPHPDEMPNLDKLSEVAASAMFTAAAILLKAAQK